MQGFLCRDFSVQKCVPRRCCPITPIIIIAVSDAFGQMVVGVSFPLIPPVHSLVGPIIGADHLVASRLPPVLQRGRNFLACLVSTDLAVAVQGLSPRLRDKVPAAAFAQCHAGRVGQKPHHQKSVVLHGGAEVAQNQLTELHDAILDSISAIIDRGGDPQFIAALENQRPDVFSDLAKVPGNGLVGDQELIYEINKGSNNYTQLYESLIKTAHKQFLANSSGNGFSCFAVQPYASLSRLMQNGNYLGDTTEKEFFALCKEVLSSKAPIPVKDDCCDCLCHVLITHFVRGKPIPEEIKGLIPLLEDHDDSVLYFERRSTLNTFLCRVLLLKLLLGKASEDEVIRWSIMLSKVDSNERVIIAKCVAKYLQFLAAEKKQPDRIILSITLQCLEDSYYGVRQYGCDCLCYLLNTAYHEHAETKLYEMAIDCSHWVRNHVVYLCKKKKIIDESIRTKLIGILENDANYAIRCYAKRGSNPSAVLDS